MRFFLFLPFYTAHGTRTKFWTKKERKGSRIKIHANFHLPSHLFSFWRQKNPIGTLALGPPRSAATVTHFHFPFILSFLSQSSIPSLSLFRFTILFFLDLGRLFGWKGKERRMVCVLFPLECVMHAIPAPARRRRRGSKREPWQRSRPSLSIFSFFSPEQRRRSKISKLYPFLFFFFAIYYACTCPFCLSFWHWICRSISSGERSRVIFGSRAHIFLSYFFLSLQSLYVKSFFLGKAERRDLFSLIASSPFCSPIRYESLTACKE